jgi:putative lipase involved disintegration of autophagic bodies
MATMSSIHERGICYDFVTDHGWSWLLTSYLWKERVIDFNNDKKEKYENIVVRNS